MSAGVSLALVRVAVVVAAELAAGVLMVARRPRGRLAARKTRARVSVLEATLDALARASRQN